jgi:hypothetical protein
MKHSRYLAVIACILLVPGVGKAQEQPDLGSPQQTQPAPQVQSNEPRAQATTENAPPVPKPEGDMVSIVAPKEIPPAVDALAHGTAQEIASRKSKPNPGEKPLDRLGGEWRKIVLFALALAAEPQKATKIEYIGTAQGETHRTDKQVGASANTTGSTSAVDKAGLPYLLGIAIDHGAIDQNINGSTLNLSSSLYALVAAVKGDTAATYQQYSGYSRVGFSAAYDLQDKKDPLASVSRRQLNEWSVKIRLFGDHSPRSAAAHAMFVNQLKPVLQNRANVMSKALGDAFGEKRTLITVPDFLKKQLNEYLDGAGFKAEEAEDKIVALILQAVKDNVYGRINDFQLKTTDVENLSDFLDRYKASTEAYVNASKTFDQALNILAEKPTLTLAYFNERGSGTPAYSVAKLLYEKKPKGFMQIDANVGASFYGNPDRTKNEQTFRDAAAAVGLEQKLGRSPFLTNDSDQSEMTMSFSGRYERLQENRHIPGKKADIAVANWKLEIPIAAGISLPLSITYANASELIKEKHVSGNFGITLDLDKLRALATSK